MNIYGSQWERDGTKWKAGSEIEREKARKKTEHLKRKRRGGSNDLGWHEA